MKILRYRWEPHNVLEMVFVPGTHGQPFPFGEGASVCRIEIEDFFIGTVPVTQALWLHVMSAGANPAVDSGLDIPMENVSWDQITRPAGFLDHINQSAIRPNM